MEITIKNIIEFIKKALDTNLDMEAFNEFGFAFYIKNSDKSISFGITNSCYTIQGIGKAFLRINHTLTEREKLSLQELVLSVRERNERRAINLFNHFLDKELTIDDLDEED